MAGRVHTNAAAASNLQLCVRLFTFCMSLAFVMNSFGPPCPPPAPVTTLKSVFRQPLQGVLKYDFALLNTLKVGDFAHERCMGDVT